MTTSNRPRGKPGPRSSGARRRLRMLVLLAMPWLPSWRALPGVASDGSARLLEQLKHCY